MQVLYKASQVISLLYNINDHDPLLWLKNNQHPLLISTTFTLAWDQIINNSRLLLSKHQSTQLTAQQRFKFLLELEGKVFS